MQRFAALLGAKREAAADVDAAVAAIIDDVRARGDAALADTSLRFDRVDIVAMGIQIGAAEVDAAVAASDAEALKALELAHARVTDYHERQKPADPRFTDALGVELGWRWRPIDAVGLYVPGGAASYPSSVVMNAVPAKVAGCRRLAMVVPTPEGHVNPLVLAAARIAGVDEIYRIGGAQAIAALAYGTETIAAGRQDRRAGQRLCRGGEAARVRIGRDRHDRGAFGGGRSSPTGPPIRVSSRPTCSPRPSTTPRPSRS